MPRPYRQDKVEVLEQLVSGAAGDRSLLTAIRHELGFRKTDRAAQCLTRVESLLRDVAQSPHYQIPILSKTAPKMFPPDSSRQTRSTIKLEQAEAYPDITNAPADILSSWIAMEVLSPQTYKNPRNLAARQDETVVFLNEHGMPWDPPGEKSKPKKKLFYQVILGSARVDVTNEELLKKYGDTQVEELKLAAGKTPLAIVLLDKDGRLVSPGGTNISSFAWSAATALKKDLSSLSGWKEAESSCITALGKYFREALEPDDGSLRSPVDWQTLQGAYHLLCDEFDLPDGFLEPPSFAIRTYTYFTEREAPEVLLLNSFYLNDLLDAHQAAISGKAPPNLRRYLGDTPKSKTFDLLENVDAIRRAVSPSLTPLARWPSKGHHPLVLLQQIAVNLALSEAKDGGLIGVNGPPGTGKSTLLRDIVAALVAERAIAMCRFDDPAQAFHSTKHSIRMDGGTVNLYELDPLLRGFEILVASSNNKAVENVSAELPNIEAIASDADLRYFQTISNALSPQRETWGIIAAVLGNRKNRGEFSKTFWRDEDFGMNSYLAAATGACPSIIKNDTEGKSLPRKPWIVELEKPPGSHTEALKRWIQARAQFQEAVQRSQNWRNRLQALESDLGQVPELERQAATSRDKLASSLLRLVSLREASADAQHMQKKSSEANAKAVTEHTAHMFSKPGFWARLFRTQRWKQWEIVERCLTAVVASTASASVLAEKAAVDCDAAVRQGVVENQCLDEECRKNEQSLLSARDRLATATAEGIVLTDVAFFEKNREEMNTSTPWFSAEAQRARNDVFIEAVNLHRAFADAAAKPLRQNLNALIGVAAIKVMKDASMRELLPSLWSSLFLLVPLVSTTFASVNQMLGNLPVESLGWLLVDEAGQALPQQMVGALIKTRRAVVVGDPLQVEPFTPLPDLLVNAIFRRFGVDPDKYAPSNGSAQTVTDLRSKFTADFATLSGKRTVGIPLLVHRRCAEPMFSISNAIAYAGLMVAAKTPNSSEIAQILGPSAWIHVEGQGIEKWCQQEGDVVVQLLRQLADAGAPLDLYIVTPFRIVQEKMRALIKKSGLLRHWLPNAANQRDWLVERVGTIHTVQGREAEAVFFVLGAPNPEQIGARNWAGKKPNLLNVAVTRAKEAIYVVGNRHLWNTSGVFSQLDAFLP